MVDENNQPALSSEPSILTVAPSYPPASTPAPSAAPQSQAPARHVIVFLPTLNEESGVRLVINGLRQQGITEIMVVDGGSTDNTVAVAREAGAAVLKQEGRGKGNAFKTFVSTYPLEDDAVYLMLDADASYSPDDAPKLLEKIAEGAEVVAGNRQVLVYSPKSLLHAIGGRLISWLASLLFLKWHPDVTTGYWAFTGGALKKMNLSAQGFELEINLFAETAKKGLRFSTAPVSYQKRVGQAKLSFKDGLKILLAVLKYRFS